MADPSTYDRALRAIGQDLSDINPESIEIAIEGDAFVVRGRTAHAPATKEEGALKKTWHKLVSRESQPKPPAASHITFTRRYDQFEIDRLDEKGRLTDSIRKKHRTFICSLKSSALPAGS